MEILRTDHDIEWLPKPNVSQFILDDVLPPVDLVTAVCAFAFDGDRFLMTRLARRGWSIPGGHVEARETPLEAVMREVYEETRAVLGELGLLGYQKNIICGPKPADYGYPHPLSFQVIYWARIEGLEPFVRTEEALERGLFAPAEAREMRWVQQYPEVYDAALAHVVGRGVV